MSPLTRFFEQYGEEKIIFAGTKIRHTKMQTITIELLDNQAIVLLQQLEKIQWLRIVESKPKKSAKLKLKLGGSIPKNVALDMQEQLTELRASWERDI